MSDATSVSSAQDRRWLILGVIGLAKLMVVLGLLQRGHAPLGHTVHLRVPGRRRGAACSVRAVAGPGAFLPMSGGLIVISNLSTTVLMPRFGPKPLVASGMLAAAGGAAWLAQLGPHTGYTTGVLGPLLLAESAWAW